MPENALDSLIPPEIKNDPFYAALQQIAAMPMIRTILEIGASSGGGSTEALASGAIPNPSRPIICSIEVSKVRFAALQQRYAAYPQIKCYNVSSVPPESFATEAEVTAFYQGTPSGLNQYPLELVLSWLKQDLDYLRTAGLQERGIELIKRENNVTVFDLALIDGSEFAGRAELDLVYGSRIIALDDILTYKNHHNFHRLQQDPRYRLAGADGRVRNGFAVFEAVNWP